MHPDIFKDNLRDVEITKVNKYVPKCPNCGRKMTFVWYDAKYQIGTIPCSAIANNCFAPGRCFLAVWMIPNECDTLPVTHLCPSQ